MTYREKLAAIVDLEASCLLDAVRGAAALGSEHVTDLERLEILCRCAKILGGDDERTPDPVEEIDEATLVTLAERS